jgi:hypothetical protein
MRGVVLCSEAAFSIDIWFLYITYRVSLHKLQTPKLEFSCCCSHKAKTNLLLLLGTAIYCCLKASTAIYMACCLRNLVAKISKQNTSDPTGQNKIKHMDYLTILPLILVFLSNESRPFQSLILALGI